MNAKEVMQKALLNHVVIPAYNIPYLPMIKPIIQAVIDNNSYAMIQVARVEWEKFSSQSLEAVAKEYAKYRNEKHTLLHLDHLPVVDEDYLTVEYLPLIKRAINAGYQSVMIDASRLDFEDNIRITLEVSDLAHSAGLPCEAELGSVMGHESNTIPYEDIFALKKGFTNVEQAKEFSQRSHCDWLSVAIGSIHGAVADSLKHQKKPEARLDIELLKKLREVTNMPLVLHGGSGINKEYMLQAIQNGIAKINVGAEIRQTYEYSLLKHDDIEKAREAVYQKTCSLINDFFCINNISTLLV